MRRFFVSTFLGAGGLWMLLDEEAPKYERLAFVKHLPADPHAWGSVVELMRVRTDDPAFHIKAALRDEYALAASRRTVAQ